MKIVKYTEAVRKAIGAKAKPEPWLHCGMNDGEYAIWVWDTRKCIESGNYNDKIDVKGRLANDNHQKLTDCHASPYFEQALLRDAPVICQDAAEFKRRIALWNTHKISIAERKGCYAFVKEMDKRYGRGRHNYAKMLRQAEARR